MIKASEKEREMYIVIYDDGNCLCIPQSWDKDCAGAICSGSYNEAVAVFVGRAEARKAINISAKFAALRKAQGQPANEDFLGECIKNLRVVPLQFNAGDKAK